MHPPSTVRQLAIAVVFFGLASVMLPTMSHAQIRFLSVDPGTEVRLEVAAGFGPDPLRFGEYGRLVVEVFVADPWYIYSLDSGGESGPPTSIVLDKGIPFALGVSFESRPILALDVVTGAVYRYHKGQARFWADVSLDHPVDAGKHLLSGTLAYSACNGIICLPERYVPFRIQIEIADGAVRPEFSAPASNPVAED